MMHLNNLKEVLRGDIDCSPEDYDESVKEACDCIDLLIWIAREVNDPCCESSLQKEKIRKKLNKELFNSKENYVRVGDYLNG